MSNFERTNKAYSEILTHTRSLAANYFNSAGVLLTVPADTPRFENGGLLMERNGANYLVRNRELSDAAWALAGVALAQDETGIDAAANTAWTITDDNAAATESIQQTVTVSDNSDDNTISVFIKKTTAATSFPAITTRYSGGSGSVSDTWILNTDDGTATRWSLSGVHGVISFESYGDFWRVIIVLPNNGTGHTSLIFQIYAAANDDAGDSLDPTVTGSCVYDYGQVELSVSRASSPISTGASVGSRGNESALDSTPDWLRTDEMTVYGELIEAVSDGANQAFVSLSDSTVNNLVDIIRDPGDSQIDVRYALFGGPSVFHNYPTANSFKFAISLSESSKDLITSINGASQTAAGYVTGPITFDRLRINTRYNGSTSFIPARAVYKNIKFLPRAMTATEMEALTA